MSVDEEYAPGRWRLSCPLPYYLAFGRCRCECGQKFKDEDRYETHWRNEHVPVETAASDIHERTARALYRLLSVRNGRPAQWDSHGEHFKNQWRSRAAEFLAEIGWRR